MINLHGTSDVFIPCSDAVDCEPSLLLLFEGPSFTNSVFSFGSLLLIVLLNQFSASNNSNSLPLALPLAHCEPSLLLLFEGPSFTNSVFSFGSLLLIVLLNQFSASNNSNSLPLALP